MQIPFKSIKAGHADIEPMKETSSETKTAVLGIQSVLTSEEWHLLLSKHY